MKHPLITGRKPDNGHITTKCWDNQISSNHWEPILQLNSSDGLAKHTEQKEPVLPALLSPRASKLRSPLARKLLSPRASKLLYFLFVIVSYFLHLLEGYLLLLLASYFLFLVAYALSFFASKRGQRQRGSNK